MTNTKKQPFLTKPSGELNDNSVIHIIHDEQDRLEAICDYGYDDLIPLTADEIWKLMPWQGMETAPIDTQILALGFFETFPCTTYLYSEDDKAKYEKWLPLPGA